jgi:cell division topological specificity factor
MFKWLQRLLSPDSGNVTPSSSFQPSASPAFKVSPLSLDENARSSACQRLKLVLMHDRTQLEPSVLEDMRLDLVKVISRYISIDEEAIEINLETDADTNTVALVANIPVVSNRAPKAVVAPVTPDQKLGSSPTVTDSETITKADTSDLKESANTSEASL